MSSRSGGTGIRAFLTAREANSLSASVTRKLEAHLENLNRNLDEELRKRENLEATIRQDAKSRSKPDETESTIANIQKQLAESNSIINDLRGNLKNLREECEKVRKERNSAVDDMESMKVSNDRQNFEIDRLKTEIEDLSSQLKKAIAEKCEALSKSDEIQNRESSLESKEKRFESEKLHLNNRIQALTEDMKKYAVDLQNIQSDHASKISKIQLELAERTEELQSAKNFMKNLREANDKLAEENRNMSMKLLSRHDIENDIVNDYKKELEAKTKLIDLYLKTIDESESRIDQLNKNMNESQATTNSLTERMKRLEAENEKLKTGYESVVDDNNATVAKLKEELEDAKLKLGASKEESLNFLLKDLSPFASSTCELIKSTSLTEVYKRMVQLSEDLTKERNKKDKLTHRISVLTEEMKEKCDTLSKQTTELNEANDTCGALKREIAVLQEKYKDLSTKFDNVVAEQNSYEKENKRLQKEVQNLSRQICFFLEEIELDDKRQMDTSTEIDSVPEELLTFGNIKELQSKNLQLLNMVNDLKAEIESVKSGQISRDSLSVIDSFNNRINELTKTQNDQNKLIDALTIQRDRYEQLYRESIAKYGTNDKNSVSVKGKNSLEGNDKASENLPKDDSSELGLLDLRKQFEEQSERYKRYKEGMLTREKILTEQVETLRKKLHDLNMTYAKLVSVSNTNNEKSKILESSVATYKKQILSLEERNKIYESSIVKQESSIKYLRDQLLESLTKLTISENSMESLRQELKFLKDSENRLRKEIDLLKKERLSQSLILNDIEFLKVTGDRKEEEHLLNLQSKLNTSMKETAELQRKLKAEEEKVEILKSQLQNLTKNTENRTNELNSVIEKNKSEISTLYDQLKAKTSQMEDLNKRLLSAINKNDKQENPDISKKLKDLENILIERQNEIEKLNIELISSKNIAEELNKKYFNLENELKTAESSHGKYKEDMEKKLETLVQSESLLKNKISKLEGELSSQPRDLNIMNSNELKVELSRSREEIKVLKADLDVKCSNLECLNKKVAKLAQIASEAEEKYKKEVFNHSTDISTMAQLKQQLSSLKTEISNLKSEKDKIEISLRELKSNWDVRETEFKKENEEIRRRLNDLNLHNELLHNQVQQLTTSNSNVGVTDNEKSLENLANIIKHLRREKEIYSTKYDIIQAEKSRMKSELDIMGRQLKDLRETLMEEKGKSKSVTQMYTINNEISKKLETLNVLTDSNVILRQERATLLNNVKELSEKLERVEQTLSTLEKDKTDLQTLVNNLQSENNNLKTESTRWKARINTLLEKTNKTRPEDWKRLQNERETLAKMLTAEKENTKKLADEILTLKTHKTKVDDELNTTNDNYKKVSEELNTIKADISKISQELMEAKDTIQEKSNALDKSKESLTNTELQLSEVSKREDNLRKIARKYKNLYEELKTKTEEEKKNTTTEGETTKPSNETDQNTEDKDINSKLAEFTTQISTLLEENAKLQQEIDSSRCRQDTEEQIKQQLTEANINISQLTEANSTLSSELLNVRGMIQVLEKDKEENETKHNSLKSQYDDRILSLEKEKSICEQEKKSISVELNRKIEFLLHKISQMQRNLDFNQSPKPSTSTYQGEQSSEIPNNANISLEYLPSSSSSSHQATQFPRNALPPESTQDVSNTVEKNQTENTKQLSHQTLNIPQAASESRMEISQAHQQAPSSSNNNNHSNSTVTTSHRIDDSDQRSRKRVRLNTDERQDDNKRAKLAELETDYQVPTSSQRDQEDDCVIIDSGDEETYQENVEDDEDKVGDDTEVNSEERRQTQNTEVERTASSAVSEGMENNEVELIESVRQDDQSLNRVHESMSNSNEARADTDGTPSVPHSPNREQQIETISSVTEGNEGGNGYMSLGMVMGNVGSAGAVNLYDDGSDSIVPSTPVLYVPRRNDGFGEAVSSPLTVSGGSAPDGHFTFNENNPSANSGVMEDTHADLTSQITPYLPATPENENIQTRESSEAEVGRSLQENVDEESPMVSSQGSLPTSPQQIEDSSEAEASTSDNQKGPWTRSSNNTHSLPSPSENRTSEYHLRSFTQRTRGQPRTPKTINKANIKKSKE